MWRVTCPCQASNCIVSHMLPAVADAVHMAMIYFVISITTMASISAQSPYLTIPCFLVVCTSIVLQVKYAKKVKACKNEFQKTNDEVFVSLSDSLEGVKILRTANQTGWSVDILSEAFMKSRISTLVNEECVVWLMRRADALGVALAFVTCIVSVALDLPSSPRGLAISSSLQIVVFYSWFMRNLAAAIYCSGSVDRVHEYTRRIPREDRAGATLETNWPKSGDVQVIMCCEPHCSPLIPLELVLNALVRCSPLPEVPRCASAVRPLASSCSERHILQAAARCKSRGYRPHRQRQEHAARRAVPHCAAVERLNRRRSA